MVRGDRQQQCHCLGQLTGIEKKGWRRRLPTKNEKKTDQQQQCETRGKNHSESTSIHIHGIETVSRRKQYRRFQSKEELS